MTFEEIVNHFNAKKHGRNYMALCPAHSDRQPSLSISNAEEKTLLHCFSGCTCEAILEATGLQKKDLYYNGGNGRSQSPSWNQEPVDPTEYFQSRGITDEIIKKYGLTYSSSDGCYLLPVKDDYVIKHYPGEKTRYKNPYGQGKAAFNLHYLQTEEKIFICESLFDALSFECIGYKAMATNSAENHSMVTNELDKLPGERREKLKLILCGDNDNAGKNFNNELSEACKKLNINYNIFSFHSVNYKDANEFYVNDKEAFIELAQQGVNGEKSKRKGLSVDDFLNLPGDIRDDAVVNNLFYRGTVSIFFGPPSAGKTWLLLDTITNLSYGNGIFGDKHSTTKPQKTLWIETDFDSLGMKDKLSKILYKPDNKKFSGVSYDLLENGEEIALNSSEGQKIIEEYIQEEKPDLLVIDSLGLALKGDESKSTDVKKALIFLKQMATNYNLHVIIITHPRKRTSIERLNRKLDIHDMSGSSFLQRYSHLIFIVDEIHDADGKIDNKAVIRNAKNTFDKTLPAFEYEIKDTIDGKVYLEFNHEELIKEGSTSEMVRSAILQNIKAMGQMTRKQLMDIINCTKSTFDRCLKELITAKQVEGNGYGKARIFSLTKTKKAMSSNTVKHEDNVIQSLDITQEECPHAMRRYEEIPENNECPHMSSYHEDILSLTVQGEDDECSHSSVIEENNCNLKLDTVMLPHSTIATANGKLISKHKCIDCGLYVDRDENEKAICRVMDKCLYLPEEFHNCSQFKPEIYLEVVESVIEKGRP